MEIVEIVSIVKLKIPNIPTATSKREATMTAPWISLMRCCHNSVLSWYVMLAITCSVGHFHSGKLRIANVGMRKENDPPWMIGNLQLLLGHYYLVWRKLLNLNETCLDPMVDWSTVIIPDTKMIVDTSWLRTGSESSMHRAGVKMNGTDIVPPIIVK